MNPISKPRRKQIRGRVREKIGGMTGNRKQQISGRMERYEGTARLEVGRVAKKIKRRL